MTSGGVFVAVFCCSIGENSVRNVHGIDRKSIKVRWMLSQFKNLRLNSNKSMHCNRVECGSSDTNSCNVIAIDMEDN